MKKIEEIRIAGSTDGDRVATMGMNFGYLFLKYMGDYHMNKEINIVVIQITKKDIGCKKYEILLNDVNTYNLYFIYTRISMSYYGSLNNFDKLIFVCEVIYKSILEWAEKYDLPIEPINVAYKKIKDEEYFLEKKKKYTSRNKKYTCGLEYRNELEFRTYRLVVSSNETNEIKKYFITEKTYTDYRHLMEIDPINWFTYPGELKAKGWVNNEEFEMYWGDEEKYIFNIKKEKLND